MRVCAGCARASCGGGEGLTESVGWSKGSMTGLEVDQTDLGAVVRVLLLDLSQGLLAVTEVEAEVSTRLPLTGVLESTFS